MQNVTLTLADKPGLQWAQQQVIAHHYLHKPVDVRGCPIAYTVHLHDERIGCLIFARPECSLVRGWYGSVEDVVAGRCPLTRWQILNLSRVYLCPCVQRGGALYRPELLPGFVDRHGVWRSTLASTVIDQALERIVFDYLVCKPPCFLDEPWSIRECLSYCQADIHKGSIYQAAHFRLVRENARHVQTYARTLRSLTEAEQQAIATIAAEHPRSKRYRAGRAVSHIHQRTFEEVESWQEEGGAA